MTTLQSVDADSKIGSFTGPKSGVAQDDNIKASLDLVNTDTALLIIDTASILANQNGTGTLIAGKTYVAISNAAVVTSALVDLFDVLGGAIEIISMFGACEVDMAGAPGALNLEIDATVADFDADFTTAVTVDALNKGDIITFAAVTSGEAVLVPTTGVNAGLPVSWYCPIGMIEQATVSTGTGSIIWTMTFRPLIGGVTVTVQ